MPSEDWIQHWTVAKFLYDWQTLIAGGLAVLAAFVTICSTIRSANREIAIAQRQIGTTILLERRRAAREGYAFHAMFGAAMGRVLADAMDARKDFSGGPVTQLAVRAHSARKRFSKKAFNELRGACVSHGGRLTETFLELENEIDNFALPAQETSPGDWMANGLSAQLDAIEVKAKHLRDEAVTGIKRANDVIAETEPTIQTPLPKRPWWKRLVG